MRRALASTLLRSLGGAAPLPAGSTAAAGAVGASRAYSSHEPITATMFPGDGGWGAQGWRRRRRACAAAAPARSPPLRPPRAGSWLCPPRRHRPRDRGRGDGDL